MRVGGRWETLQSHSPLPLQAKMGLPPPQTLVDAFFLQFISFLSFFFFFVFLPFIGPLLRHMEFPRLGV